MQQDFFYQAFIYLAAAVVAVPLAKRLGLGAVLGYLIAGEIELFVGVDGSTSDSTSMTLMSISA